MSSWYLGALAINVVIVIGILFSYRHVQAKIAGVSSNEELAQRDNYAFGISVASGLLALCFVLAAAVSGEIAVSLPIEALNVLVYAISGAVLLKLGMIINDRLIMRSFSISEQLRNSNMAVGVVNGANLIAQGIIIAAAINWVEVESWQGLAAVTLVWFASQIVLSLVAFIRMAIYKSRHEGQSWQQAIAANNCALAIRFAGQIVATAIAVTAVSNLVIFLPELWLTSLLAWLGYSIAMVIAIWGLYRLVLPTVLHGINVVEEVDDQHNIGVAFIEASLFLGVALILQSMLA